MRESKKCKTRLGFPAQEAGWALMLAQRMSEKG